MNFLCKFLFIIACMNNRIIKMVDGRDFHETKMMAFPEKKVSGMNLTRSETI